MGRPIRVLQVEHSPEDFEVVLLKLRKAGYDPAAERVETGASLRAALSRGPWDVVLCDCFLPGLDPEAALQAVREADPPVAFLIVSGSIGGDRVADLLRAGADDHVFKGRLSRLGPAVERALREAERRRAAGG
jgi:two-component system sensor histidine kinase UhpB